MNIVRHDYTISFLEAKHQQQRINKLLTIRASQSNHS